VKVTFHGGEPLSAGHELWRQALDGLRDRFGIGGYEVALQSNLWALDDVFCELFAEHRVEVGTSVDGPEDITDSQRGAGYFARTMAGVGRARARGLDVGCIATFTAASAPRWRVVFDFFVEHQLGWSVHAAVPRLGGPTSSLRLTPAAYRDLLLDLADAYVDRRHDTDISSLNQVFRGVASGEGKVCTFRDCSRMFLAIDPEGGIYHCQRLAGRPEWRLGDLHDEPTSEELYASPVGVRLREREARVADVCGECPHLAYCRGGCPYNAWASGGVEATIDPYCEAYRAVFDHVQQRLAEEMGSEANIAAVAERPYDGRGHPLLRRGPLIDLCKDGPHPRVVARTARRIIAAVEMARGPDDAVVAERLVAMGICRSRTTADASIAGLRARLFPEQMRLNSLYLHVTFSCQLRCTHCYARAEGDGQAMPVDALTGLLVQAEACGFRQVVLTGGEPLVHPDRHALLAALRDLRAGRPSTDLVLRTNLAVALSEDDLRSVAEAVDQVVVSVDGDEALHDARRGPGAYAAVVANLERYAQVASETARAGELSLAGVLRSADIRGEPGDAVRALAARLGVRRTRFRPLLPLGRAADWDEPPTSEALGSYADPMNLIEGGFHPVSHCGLGQNLYVEPSGESFPCYAFHGPYSYLGNVIQGGLAAVLASEPFRDLARHSVDTNPTCRVCEVRYLCGGACRAWGGEATQCDLDAPPPECAGLRGRAESLLAAARGYLGLGGKGSSC